MSDQCCGDSNQPTTTETNAAASSCCGDSSADRELSQDEIRDYVRTRYGQVAQGSSSCCGGQKDADSAKDYASRLGYSDDDLAGLPDLANLGLSCGNPVAISGLVSGEVVVDLGSGGGLDCFIAGRKVGNEGRVIGIDMTPDMLALARKNLAGYRREFELDNVEFRLGEIEHLPVADNSADLVISNCVINLSVDKPQVWSEIYRILKPGGRVAVSDIALLQPIPQELRDNMELVSACVSGAVMVEEYVQHMITAGLENIEVSTKDQGELVWESSKDQSLDELRKNLPRDIKISDYAISVNVTGRKPQSAGRCC